MFLLFYGRKCITNYIHPLLSLAVINDTAIIERGRNIICKLFALKLHIQNIVEVYNYLVYHIEGNVGGCKLWWRINYKNTFGDMNCGEFEHL